MCYYYYCFNYYYLLCINFFYWLLFPSSLNHSTSATERRAIIVQRRGAGNFVEHPIRLIWTSLPGI